MSTELKEKIHETGDAIKTDIQFQHALKHEHRERVLDDIEEHGKEIKEKLDNNHHQLKEKLEQNHVEFKERKDFTKAMIKESHNK